MFFYSRKNASKEVLNLFNEKERENAYFSPFADWTANGRADSGSWTIYGRKDMRGWKFVYVGAKLRKIEAPSGQHIDFIYADGKLASVEQRGRAFVSLKYNDDKTLSEILINGVSSKFAFRDGKAQILPETLAGKEEHIDAKFLRSVGRNGLNPLEFSYDGAGYLARIKRGDCVDNISAEHETLAQRKNYLKKVAAAKRAKKNPGNVAREAVAGRIIEDSTYKYSYLSGKPGNVELENRRGEVAKFEFDSARGIAKHTDFSGKAFTTYYFMRYDVAYNGKVRQIVDGRKRALASYRYDKDTGKITRYRDMAQNDINFKYDSRGNLVLITRRGADDAVALPVRSFSYNKGSLKPSKVSELNEKGEPVKTVSIQYDSECRPVHIGDGRNALKISYNFYGYPSKVVDAYGAETVYAYDIYNRRISGERDGLAFYADYGKLGLPVKGYSVFEGKLLSSIEISYDKNGFPVSYRDQDGLEKKYERDEFGRIVKEIFPDSAEVEYEYDALGKLAKVIDQNGHEINFAWNKHGLDFRRTAVGQIAQNVYDEYGRLSAAESRCENGPAERSLAYRYDEFDRIAGISYGASENEILKYDTWGRLIEKSKNGLISKYKYDHFGRLVEKLEGGSLTKYAYDNYGKRLSRITTGSNGVLDEYNTYDKFGRLVKTLSNGETVEYVYNDRNRFSRQIIGENSVEFKYTKLGRLAGKTLFGKDGKALSELKYFYSKSGRLTSRLANGKLQEYKYDARNQLLAVIDAESRLPVETYVYDAGGNILQKTARGEVTTYSYDAANQLASSIAPDDNITKYAYDAAGRLVQEGDKTYEYGWLDKVTRVLERGREVARFEYHGNGQIAKAVRENGIETFEWDGLALIKRNNTKYINEPHPGGGNPVLAMGKNIETIFTDMLGTSLGIVERGNTYVAIDKTSFGNPISESISNASNTFYTGKPYIDGLGYAFLFRNYRPDLGKWPSQDPIGYPDGWNNFAYCNNIAGMAIDYLGAVLTYPPSMQGSIDIISNTSSGKAIINQLRNSSNIHTIVESASGKGSSTSATNNANAMNGKGSGSTINMDNLNLINSSADGSGWNRPYELGIMHELKHAADMDKGNLDNTKSNNGIEKSEIDACRETNKVLKELQEKYPGIYDTYEPRKTYGGHKLPDSAINPE